MEDINYDKLLDDWAEKLYILIDKHEAIKDSEECGTSKWYTSSGISEGLRTALATLTMMERKFQRSRNE